MFDYNKQFKDESIFENQDEIFEEDELIEEIVDDIEEEKTIIGVVDVDLLNIRSSMDVNSDNIVAKVKKGSELLIMNDKDSDWYEVCTASGVDGYAMKKFITV